MTPKSTRTVLLLATALWMLVIFLFSAQAGDDSERLSRAVTSLVASDSGGILSTLDHFVVRKLGHIINYVVLGVLLFFTLRAYSSRAPRAISSSVIIGGIYAATDEFHQLFSQGRGASVADVLLDTASILLGIVCVLFITKTIHIRRAQHIASFITSLGVLMLALATTALWSVKLVPRPMVYAYIVATTLALMLATMTTRAALQSRLSRKHLITTYALTLLISTLALSAGYFVSIVDRVSESLYSPAVEERSYALITPIGDTLDTPSILGTSSIVPSQAVSLATEATQAKGTQALASPTDTLQNVAARSMRYGILPTQALSVLKVTTPTDYQKVRVLKTLTLSSTTTKDSRVPTRDKDATPPDSFILYISGIDTYGDISSVSRSDVNILAVVNQASHRILLVTTPRDYYVQLHGTSGLRDKLTHAGIYGIQMSSDTLADLYGVEIPYYVRINFESLVRIVDAIGGIDVESDYNFSAGGYQFVAGINRLDGKQALAFSRERYSFEGGDRTRGQNQQRVITAIINKYNQDKLGNIPALINNLSGLAHTNIPTDLISRLGSSATSGHAWQTESISVDGTSAMAPTYSIPGQNLYVMEPDQTSLDSAKAKIQEYLQK